MIEMMTPEHRAAIRGETDSEHVFHLILSMNDAMPDRPLVETLSLSRTFGLGLLPLRQTEQACLCSNQIFQIPCLHCNRD